MPLTKWSVDEIKEYGMAGACGTYYGRDEESSRVLVAKPEGKSLL
jgi:hypothetical protein